MNSSNVFSYTVAMRFLTVALIGLSNLFIHAQDWPYDDSRWQYDFSVAGGLNGTYEMNVGADTVLNGFTAKVIELRDISNWPQQGGGYTTIVGEFEPFAFVRSSGDSVLYWSDDEFFLLYDYSSEIGDGWLVYVSPSSFPGCEDSTYVSVYGTGLIDINGMQRRYIDLQTDSETPFGLSGRVIEGIGLVSEFYEYGFTLFPGIHPCGSVVVDGADTDFKCYSDGITGNYSPDGENCWFVGVDEFVSSKFSIFPSPAEDQIHIRSAIWNWTQDMEPMISLFDNKGRTVDAQIEHWSPEESVLQVSHLSPGLYTVIIQTHEGVVAKRFIKN